VEQQKKCGNNQAFDSVNTRPTARVRSQVQVVYGTTEWFPIKNSTRQGCILSHGLFNLYSEYIIKTGGVCDMVTGNGNVTWKINTTKHVDDSTLILQNTDDMTELIKWVKKHWKGGSQFEPRENYSNEQCGKSKHIFRWRRQQQSNEPQVFGGSHHQWRDQVMYKLQQSSNGTFEKDHKGLGCFNQHKFKLL